MLDSDTYARGNALGIGLGVIGVVIFGGTLPATRLAVASLDPGFVTAGRAAIAGLLAATTLLILRRPLPPRELWRKFAFSSFLVAAGFPLSMGIALKTSEASHGGVVMAILPLATAAAATIAAGERPSLRFWFFSLLGAAAVFAFVITSARGAWNAADALFVLAAASASLGYAMSGTLSRTMPGWEVICWQLVIALPFCASAALMLASDIHFEDVSLSSWLGFGYVSLFSMFLGFFAWNAGLALGGVARIGQLQLLQVFVTLGLSSLLLHERLGASVWIYAAAVALIVAAGRRSPIRRKALPQTLVRGKKTVV